MKLGNNILVPESHKEPNQVAPIYEDMDNLTLLSTLCIHSDSPSAPLLPELD